MVVLVLVVVAVVVVVVVAVVIVDVVVVMVVVIVIVEFRRALNCFSATSFQYAFFAVMCCKCSSQNNP